VNNLGDCVVFLPVAAAARAAWPEARLTLLTGRRGAEAAALTGLMDDVLPLPPSRRYPPKAKLLALVPRLRAEKFDLAFMAGGDSSFVSLLLYLGGVKTRIGFADCSLSGLLTSRVKATALELEARRNFRLAEMAGLTGPMPRPPCRIRPEMAEAAQRRLSELGVSLSGAPLLLVHPGSSTPLRRWPAERFAELCRRVTADGLARPLLLEGPAEAGLGESLGAQSHAPVLRNVESIELLGAIMAQCGLFLGQSSGPMHVAFLVGTPTVSLWGDADPAIWGPAWEEERHLLIRTPHPCAGCAQWTARHAVTRCRPGMPCESCMEAVTLDTVLEAVERQLRTLSARRP